MNDEIRCKRIINGKTYNTETATRLWHYEDPDGPPIEEVLYKTRHGAYFLYYRDDTAPTEGIKPLTPDETQKWLEAKSWHPDVVKLIESEFGEMPEAGEAEARITVRIPETLRKRIAALAKERQQSVNAWIMRCLEQCAANAEAGGANHETY